MWRNTEYESRRCARRLQLDLPWSGDAFALYSATDGRPGLGVLSLSAVAAQAMREIGAGVAWGAEQREEERKRRDKRG